MPHSNDIDESVCTDDQLLLLDLLYGELDESAEKGARDAIESDTDLRSELAEFEQLRGLMRELPDEEPSAALTAKLMHAAATGAPAQAKTVAAADVAAAGGGFFAWLKKLFEPMMMHPGLAAAASLVLVAGIAGALYLGGNSQMAEPTADRASAVKSEVAPAATAPAGPPLANPAPAKAGAGTAAPGNMADDLPAGTTSLDEGRTGKLDSTERNQRSRGDMTGGLLDSDKTVAKPKPKIQMKSPSRRSRPKATGKDSNQFELGASGDAVAPASRPTARPRPTVAPKTPKPPSQTTTDRAPEAPRKPAPRKPTSVRGSSGSTISAEPPPPPDVKPADEEKTAGKKKPSAAALRLHQEARSASKKGDCKRVVAIAGRMRRLDSHYYDTKFLGDSLVRRCLRSKSNAGSPGDAVGK